MTYNQSFDVENRLISVQKVGTGTTTFAYDANGIRVKTVKPNGDTIYMPYPNYEEEVRGGITIQRSTYSLVGQMVAIRVSGDPVAGNNGLFYYHGDHLGSTSALTSTSNGYVVGGSIARYAPYGAYCTTPAQTVTSRHFTGHKHNDDLGLVYMNARFYVPSVGRFAAAGP